MVELKDIPIFCINLTEATKRWENIEKQAKFYGLNIQRWEGTRPSEIPPNFSHALSPNVKAATYSHVRIWNHCLEQGWDSVFILEDDAKFRHDWISIVNEKLKTLEQEDAEWDALWLNASEEIEQKETWKQVTEQYLAGAYIIHRRAIEWLLNTYESSTFFCIDWMTTRLQLRGHVYSYFPWLAIQDGSPSFCQQDNSADYNKVLRLLKDANYDLEKYNMDYKPSDRLSWKDYFSQLCVLVSKRSPCTRLHVGCVLVKDNHIISTGYNGFLPGAEHKSLVIDGHEQATLHAEQNCIADCAKRGVSTEGATAYITHYPCVSCFKSLVGSGVKEIFYLNDYRVSPIVSELMKGLDVKLEKI
jgi:dCMP deaminase